VGPHDEGADKQRELEELYFSGAMLRKYRDEYLGNLSRASLTVGHFLQDSASFPDCVARWPH